MLRTARTLEKFELAAPDGRIGHVTDLLFDDRRWTVRYFVVSTGTWLAQREVLVSPAAVHAPDWRLKVLPVDLTREQIRLSPGVDTEQPVSHEQELALIQYYSWPMYWGAPGFADPLLFAAPPLLPGDGRLAPRLLAPELDAQHHVRSVADVRGYRIEANDGGIGHVDDFLLDDRTWTFRFLVVDTRNVWPGRRVLVSPEWIYDVGWEEATVAVDLSREAVRRSPVYDPDRPVTEDYADALHEHYGQPHRSAEP